MHRLSYITVYRGIEYLSYLVRPKLWVQQPILQSSCSELDQTWIYTETHKTSIVDPDPVGTRTFFWIRIQQEWMSR